MQTSINFGVLGKLDGGSDATNGSWPVPSTGSVFRRRRSINPRNNSGESRRSADVIRLKSAVQRGGPSPLQRHSIFIMLPLLPGLHTCADMACTCVNIFELVDMAAISTAKFLALVLPAHAFTHTNVRDRENFALLSTRGDNLWTPLMFCRAKNTTVSMTMKNCR